MATCSVRRLYINSWFLIALGSRLSRHTLGFGTGSFCFALEGGASLELILCKEYSHGILRARFGTNNFDLEELAGLVRHISIGV